MTKNKKKIKKFLWGVYVISVLCYVAAVAGIGYNQYANTHLMGYFYSSLVGFLFAYFLIRISLLQEKLEKK